jgi:hypothetical protein
MIRAEFGRDYVAIERAFVMGIDQRSTARIAERFHNRRVVGDMQNILSNAWVLFPRRKAP